MTTTNWIDRLSDYLDGTLTPEERSACEAWLASSAEGQALLQDLRRVVARAKTLPDVAVPEGVWAGIARGIKPASTQDAQVLPLEPPRRRAVSRSRRWQFSPLQLAAAAVIFLAVGIGTGLEFRKEAKPSFEASQRVGAVPVQLARRADASYDKAVQELQLILDQHRSTMDTATVRVLESSLARIDAALAEAQKALDSDPRSAYLNDHLGRIKRKKLDLLRQGASLVQAS